MAKSEEVKDVEIPENFDIKYLQLSDGVKLRYLSYHPEGPKGRIFLYPGMNTLVMSWIKILEGLSEEGYRIDYVESREKYTAILPEDYELTQERMIEDCIEASNILGLNGQKYIAIGSSLGSNTLIRAMSEKEIEPTYAILVGPSAEFDVPLFIRLVLPFVTTWTYNNIGRPLLKKIVIRKYTNEDADPKQKRKYALALDLAEPIRLKRCLKTWRKTEIWKYLDRVDGEKSTCLFIGASEDKLHPDEETKLCAEKTENAQYIDLKTNSAAHDQPLIDLINDLDLS